MKRLRLISTILIPSAKGERIVKFRQYTGNERETGLGVNMYDFNACSYVASYPLFGRPDPKCREFPWLNPYSFCGGDPINHTDPNGCEIRGHSKRDAELAVEEMKVLRKVGRLKYLMEWYSGDDEWRQMLPPPSCEIDVD